MAVRPSGLPVAKPEPGWRRPRLAPSLAEVYRSVPIRAGGWWRKALAFAGPGYLVAVGYMDPGNWATDLAGGSAFGYTLLSVVFLSNLMAILLQGLAAKLGIVTGRDLAQACRDPHSRPTTIALWVLCEVAIAACDLAEVIGSAIGLNLLFGIPLPWGIAITALDVLIVLFLQHKGFRLLEALVVALIATIAGCFLFEIVISRPDLAAVASGFVPSASILADREKLYIAIGILGATVMPHNLYLHSSVVQTRAYEETPAGKRMAVKFAFLDSTVALSFALFINAAILIVAAAARAWPKSRKPISCSRRCSAWPARARCSRWRCSRRGRIRRSRGRWRDRSSWKGSSISGSGRGCGGSSPGSSRLCPPRSPLSSSGKAGPPSCSSSAR